MKQIQKFFILSFIVCIIIGLYFLPFYFKQETIKADEAKPKSKACDIFIKVKGSEEEVNLEEYVVGVLAGEMPVSFHLEALKAQAIASRTYALKTTNLGKEPIEPTVLNQVYVNEDERKKLWQNDFHQYEEKIRKAVEETRNQVIYFGDELITAMFHSMSNGMTESAENYSGTNYPYLQPVVSADFQNSSTFVATKSFTLSEWNNILKGNWTSEDIRKIKLKRNNTGRVDTVILGKSTWTGKEFRELFNLRSTDFQIHVNQNNIQFITEGYGHGVGMSQYGANAMANSGKTAEEILQHYYQNTEIKKIICEK